MATGHVTGSNTQVKQTLEEVKHRDGKPLLVVEDTPDCSSPSSVASYSTDSSFGEYNDNEKGTLHTNNQVDGNLQQDSTLSQQPGRLSNSSQLKIPPPQTMGRPGEYDPNRIPTSIFSSKPSNQTDWSVASNESLFSIHMGNSSFREQHTFFGKSGELPKLEDSQSNWSNSQSNWSNSQPNLPPVMEVPTNEDNENEDSKGPRVVPEAGRENHVQEIVPAEPDLHHAPSPNLPRVDVTSPSDRSLNSSSERTSPTDRRLSHESGASYSSFAFPVLVSEGAKSSSSLNVVLEKSEKLESESPPTPKASPMKCFPCFWWSKCCC